MRQRPPQVDGQVARLSTWLRALRQAEHRLPDDVVIIESSSGRTPHVVRDRGASELPAERQTLRGHNSAPQANHTLLRLELKESSQAEKQIS